MLLFLDTGSVYQFVPTSDESRVMSMDPKRENLVAQDVSIAS